MVILLINVHSFDIVTLTIVIVIILIKVIANFPSTHSVTEGDCETYCDDCCD